MANQGLKKTVVKQQKQHGPAGEIYRTAGAYRSAFSSSSMLSVKTSVWAVLEANLDHDITYVDSLDVWDVLVIRAYSYECQM